MGTRNVFLLLILLLGMGMSSCSKESMQGPQGIKGPQGEMGPKGEKGEQGEGISIVKKFVLDIDKGTGFAAQGKGPWAGRIIGLNNAGIAYAINAETETGGLSINNADYLVFAYALPEGSVEYAQKKMLPYTFGLNTYGLKIELINSREEIFISKIIDGWKSDAPAFAEVPTILHVEIFFVEKRPEEKLRNLNPSNYDEMNDYFQQQETPE